jgi:putative ABC transport system permease protein
VTLVLVQVGLFMGLLDKATVTIEHASADIWVTSKETPNVDFAHNFPETTVLRVRSVPGVARADNLVIQFMNIQLPTGAEEGCLVYALEDFGAWNLPWNVQGADVRDLRRGRYLLVLVKVAPGADPPAVAAAIRRVAPYNDVTLRRWST